jgi:hypothetical protein
MKALYFAQNDKKLRYDDNRKIIVGETHKVDCVPKCCEVGLHGSVKAMDALNYAPGSILYLVEIEGDIDKNSDKICGTSRKYLDEFNVTDLLRKFAKSQALINIDKIKDYCSEDDFNVVLDFLNGNDELRESAWSAELAAWSEARSAAWSAELAAWSEARSAAWSAESAAWSAAESAVWSAWSAARSAERSAANNLLCDMIEKETGWDLSFSRCEDK